MALAGCWEFPGGKVERRESPRAALAREIEEELGLAVEVGDWIGRGESIVDGREIVLDVYRAAVSGGELRSTEHAQTRWITAGEIDGLDWAEADRPMLPFLRRVLRRAGSDSTLERPVPIVSVDWAKQKKGRAVCVASPDAGGWIIERAEPPAGGWSFRDVLARAEALADRAGTGCLVAVDAVLGLPARFGTRTEAGDFPAAVAWLEGVGGLDGPIRAPADWRPETPFFAVAKGDGGLTRFIERAGGRSGVLRQIERATGAKPVFALSGIPGTVGSGSVALWRELLAVRRSGGAPFALWPFEVEL
ncbi:MAG TPA: (deoxy)nucleoside triphosphate pyrophosphohydrolase, partial [Myxococcota bacterium]|nr:(deoxy)nucleoside triphosphate pyrophosphohydrolase [Myxococcota bacterium]